MKLNGLVFHVDIISKNENELQNFKEKKTKLYYSMKICREKNLCICIDVYRRYTVDDIDKLTECLLTLKKGKLILKMN